MRRSAAPSAPRSRGPFRRGNGSRVSFADDQRIERAPDVLARVLDGEAVLLDLASGTYFGLNEVGTRVWDLVGERRTVASIREALLAEYDVTPDRLAADLDELLSLLAARGLVRAVES